MALPEHYPFADASDAEVRFWVGAGRPAYPRIREAAPWLKSDAEVEAYLAGLRAGLAGEPFLATHS